MTTTIERVNSLLNPPEPNPEDPGTWRIQPMEDVQRAAATAPEGPLVIMGGAGTGKSRVLENRVIHLAKAGASPTNIAVITFNARAALRLRGELFPAIGADPANLGFFIGTMHKYCSVLLRQAGWKHVGLNPAFTISDQEQSITVLEEVVARDAPDEPPRYSRTQLQNILQWFDLNRSIDDGDEVPPRDEDWNEYVHRYQNEKRQQQLVDFTDLLVLTREALENNRNLRETYANIRTRHLIVDEFQDLTPLQYRLLRLMTGPTKSVTVALDPNQSIYQWRGADPEMFKRFTYDYNDTQVRGLSINHRTSARIMRAWRTMARNPLMTGLYDDGQTGLRPGGEPPQEYCIEGLPPAQYSAIADRIQSLIADEGYQPRDIAVLSRRRASIARMSTQLDSRDIPYLIIGEHPGRPDPNAECITAMLTLAANPSNTWALRKAADCNVTRQNRNLNHVISRNVREAAQEAGSHLIDAAKHVMSQLNTDNDIYMQLNYAVETWTGVRHMLEQPDTLTADIIRYVHDQMYRHGTGRPQRQLAPSINRMLTIAERSDRDIPGANPPQKITAFLESMANSQNPDQQSDENEDPFKPHQGISVGTVYGSKGLQWPVVFFADCSAQFVPGERVKDNTHRMNEEQRLFYTGVTRAEDRLYIYWSRQQDDGSEAAPSKFIETLGAVSNNQTPTAFPHDDGSDYNQEYDSEYDPETP